MDPKQSLSALFPPTYRLIGSCLAVGALGALAALAFDAAVSLAQRLLLVQITGYMPPAVGMLNPAAVIPDLSYRWWLPVATGLGGLLSGLLVFTFAPEAEGHGTDAAGDQLIAVATPDDCDRLRELAETTVDSPV